MNIVLIGFRGVGKGMVGKALAKKFNKKFIDTDKEIVKATGKSIPEIFAELGERGFREIEKKIIEKVSKEENAVIATGGGAPMNEENRKNLKKNAVVVWLQAKPEIIFERIKDDQDRPALTDKEPFEEIRHLLNAREPVYSAFADFSFESNRQPVKEIVDKIAEKLGSKFLEECK